MEEEKNIQLSYLQKQIFGDYLQGDENVVYIIQNHWWLFLVDLFKLSLLFVPSTVYLIIFGQTNKYLYLIALSTSLISFLFLALRWYNLYADAFILTDKNIIFVQWDSIVKINSSRISYSDVSSASIEMEGFASTLFGYGRVRVETPNENFKPEIKGARNASEAERQILQCKEKYTESENVDAHIFKNALREIFDEYILEKKVIKVDKEEIIDNVEARFEKYKIRGTRFHAGEDLSKVPPADLKSDRFEKYRLKEEERNIDEESKDL